MLDTLPVGRDNFSLSQRTGRPAGGDRWDALAATAILVLGYPRSGTTWLAKIFDSHPDILYRHEPDELSPARPDMAPNVQIRTWLRQRGLRSAAKRPRFPSPGGPSRWRVCGWRWVRPSRRPGGSR